MTNDSMLLKEERETLHRGRYEGYAPCFISSVLHLPLCLARPLTETSEGDPFSDSHLLILSRGFCAATRHAPHITQSTLSEHYFIPNRALAIASTSNIRIQRCEH